jgi:MFS family permease
MEMKTNKNRISVSFFFFVNGFLHANLMARLPELKNNLNISNSVLGALLFAMSVGALIAMPITGWLTTQYGSAKITKIASILFCLCIPLIPISSSFWIVGVCFLTLGMSTGSMDVAMNGQAVYVEREIKKPIMSSFHACFSIGMATGAGVGALFSHFKVPLMHQLFMMGIVSLGAIIFTSKNLIKSVTHTKTNLKVKHKLPILLILPFGIIAFCCMIVEGSMVDWSAVYMNKVIGGSLILSAFTFGVFSAGMTIGRLFGDFFNQKIGTTKLLIIDTSVAILGLCLALIFSSIYTTLIGFFLVGLGVSTIIPIIFTTAGNLDNVDASIGISTASSIGYFGFFIGPPTIGFIADAYGLRAGLYFSMSLAILMLLLILQFFRKQ